MNIGAAARRIRKARGLSQRAAADAINVSYVHLNRIEQGHASPSPELLEKISKSLGVDPYVLAWCDWQLKQRGAKYPILAAAKKLREAIEEQIGAATP